MTIHVVLFFAKILFFVWRNALKCYVFKWLSPDAGDGHQLHLLGLSLYLYVHFCSDSLLSDVVRRH